MSFNAGQRVPNAREDHLPSTRVMPPGNFMSSYFLNTAMMASDSGCSRSFLSESWIEMGALFSNAARTIRSTCSGVEPAVTSPKLLWERKAAFFLTLPGR